MATSSIFASFDIKDKKIAENFVCALEESKKIHHQLLKLKVK